MGDRVLAYIDGENKPPKSMNESEFVDYTRAHPDKKFKCLCEECKQPARITSKANSFTGFSSTSAELAKRGKTVPFTHIRKNNNNVKCSSFVGADPRLANRDSSGESRKKQIEVNRKTIDAMRSVLGQLEEALYFEMTGKKDIPAAALAELAKLEKDERIIGKTGLADKKNAYRITYIKFAALSPQPREFEDGVRMVVFKPQGDVVTKEKRHNGRVEDVHTPIALILHYTDPADEVLLDGKNVRCPVKSEAAHDLILDARARRAAPPVPVVAEPPRLQQQAVQSVVIPPQPEKIQGHRKGYRRPRAVAVHPNQNPLIPV